MVSSEIFRVITGFGDSGVMAMLVWVFCETPRS